MCFSQQLVFSAAICNFNNTQLKLKFHSSPYETRLFEKMPKGTVRGGAGSRVREVWGGHIWSVVFQ